MSQKYSVPAPDRKSPALDDVSVSIAQNKFFTLLGPSGCDKTTLIRWSGGFRHSKPDSIFLE
tara:strand:+ start:154 stop:339 length:186 start_codon:yes stop_codon:yes gene_type:complete